MKARRRNVLRLAAVASTVALALLADPVWSSAQSSQPMAAVGSGLFSLQISSSTPIPVGATVDLVVTQVSGSDDALADLAPDLRLVSPTGDAQAVFVMSDPETATASVRLGTPGPWAVETSDGTELWQLAVIDAGVIGAATNPLVIVALLVFGALFLVLWRPGRTRRPSAPSPAQQNPAAQDSWWG